MAKCYECKYLNMQCEAKKHENPTTLSMTKILRERMKKADRRSHHFCEVHRAN